MPAQTLGSWVAPAPSHSDEELAKAFEALQQARQNNVQKTSQGKQEAEDYFNFLPSLQRAAGGDRSFHGKDVNNYMPTQDVNGQLNVEQDQRQQEISKLHQALSSMQKDRIK